MAPANKIVQTYKLLHKVTACWEHESYSTLIRWW